MEEDKKSKKQKIKLADTGEVKKVLSKLKKESEEEETSKYAKKIGMSYLDLNIFPIDQEHVPFIPEEDARKYNVVVIHKVERELKLATTTPEDPETKQYIKELEKSNKVEANVFVVSNDSIQRVYEEYKKVKLADVFDYLRMGLSGDDLKNFEEDMKGLVDLEKRITEIPVTEVMNMIIAGAIKLESSDIHMEPQKNGKTRLRYRIDGVLQTVAEFPLNIYVTVVSRIKVLSKMMVNVRDIAQDGRFSIKQEGGEDIDMRVSVLPGNFGENIVMRLLMHGAGESSLEELGIMGLNYEWLINEIEKKQGIIINSGPTGSGKTTTLYSIIDRLNSPDKKIVSIEDPIEYQVPGVSQTQIEAERGYTFASGLRAIVRQDPDIILVGEIRDEETAEVAVQAALTGHLVLTTVHANSAAGVVGRLTDLGVKASLISPAVNAFIAQRLLRKLCPHCRESYSPAQETVDTLKKILSLISPKAKVQIPKKIDKLWRPKGCSKCHGLGYKGRVGVFEVMTISQEMQEMIEHLGTEDEIRNVALENGMITLEQDGILKSVQGITSLEELQRVVGKGEYLLEMYENIVVQDLSRGTTLAANIFDDVRGLKSDYGAMKDKFKDFSPSEMVMYTLASALLTNTGDVHIEPGESEFKVRFRIDGVLHDIVKLPMNEFLNVLNEVKNLVGAKTEENEGILDGRFKIMIPDEVEEVNDKSVDIRVSVIRGGFGDTIVMRLLNQTASSGNIESLGISPYNLDLIKNNVSKPNGIILNTGPTGSGKTTTLYSILAHLNDPQLKIITVEDPIEYQMDGILQTQVNEEEGYTFTTAVEALLQQNPDIMMIGEVRDHETADATYQAALAGHLVLSTLHTNSAAGSLQRLMNMGVNPSDLAEGTNCFMAQRLVRVLCPHCKKKTKPAPKQKKQIEEVLGTVSPKTGLDIPKTVDTIYEPVGCDKCHNLGYSGRMPITEVLEISGEVQKLLAQRPTTAELNDKGIEEGMLSLAQDGILKVVQGETSFNEIARVTREVEGVERKKEQKEDKKEQPKKAVVKKDKAGDKEVEQTEGWHDLLEK